MGKDLMLFFLKSENRFESAPTIDSYMSLTFPQKYKNAHFDVWRDKINGFQHTYGSALAAHELGDYFADKLFVANEFAEWLFDKNGVSERDLRDRRRDLANNKTGRGIAIEARKAGYSGHDAEEFMRDRIVVAMEYERTVITHWRSSMVDALPSESELGCPLLPTQNGFDCCKAARKRFKRTRQRIDRRLHFYWNKVEALIT